MKTIWKYKLAPADVQGIEMPAGAVILTMQAQGPDFDHGPGSWELCIWCLVDDKAPKVFRKIVIAGTGHDATAAAAGKYIGSAQLSGGQFIFHAFDGGEFVPEPGQANTKEPGNRLVDTN